MNQQNIAGGGAWLEARCTRVPRELRCLCHGFRRPAGVRNLEQSGVSRSVAMKLTGHKTEAVYRRYAIVSSSDLQATVGKLDTALGHNPGHNGTFRTIVGGRK
jgi:hypothetical protein